MINPFLQGVGILLSYEFLLLLQLISFSDLLLHGGVLALPVEF